MTWIICIFLFAGYIIYTYKSSGQISSALDSYNFILIISAATLFYIVRYLFEKKFNKLCSNIISEINLTTFGTYLIHYLVIYKIYNISVIQKIFDINVYLGFTSLVLSVFIGCTIIIFILRRIPIIKKFL